MSPARRGFLASGGSLGFVLLVLAILALANYISQRRFVRLDLTKNREYTVTPATKRILAGLDDVVNVTAYFSKDLPPYMATLDRQVKDLLDEYRAFGGERLRVTFEDPGDDPRKEQQLQMLGIPKVQLNILEKEKAQVTNVYLGIAVQYGDKTEALPVVQSAANLEYDLTSAILKVTAAPPKVGLLTGHGEPGMERGQLSLLSEALRKQYEVVPLDQAGGQPVPADVKTLLVVRPTETIPERDLYEIDQFVMRGGRLLALVDGTTLIAEQLMMRPFESGMNTLLSRWGARVNSDLLVDASNVTTTFSSGFMSFLIPYPWFVRVLPENLDRKNPATAGLQSVVLPWVGSIELTAPVDTTGAAPAGGVSAEVLATTSAQSFRQSGGLSVNPQQRVAPSDPADLKEHPVAVALTGTFGSAFAGRPAPAPDDSAAALLAPTPATRDASLPTQVVVVADGDLAMDQFASQYPENQAFLMNVVDWLTLGDQLIAVRSRGNLVRPLKPVSDGARSAIKFANLLGVPLLVGAFGVVRWMNRRRGAGRLERYRS
jgi:ABC-2 type transport system permease protein